MAERMKTREGWIGAALLCCVLFLIAMPVGAAQPSRRALQDFADFLELLGGRFASLPSPATQPDEEATRRETLRRVIVPVKAGFIGDTIFYVQETVGGDGRRVIGQQLMLLAMAPGAGIVETPVLFNEPLRWRDGDRNPELFRSILPQDVKPLAGCEVLWRRVAQGFDGMTDPVRCRSSVGGAGPARVERQYALRAEGLVIRERRFDESGKLLSEEAPLQYRRQLP
jgi:hypothetical protein